MVDQFGGAQPADVVAVSGNRRGDDVDPGRGEQRDDRAADPARGAGHQNPLPRSEPALAEHGQRGQTRDRQAGGVFGGQAGRTPGDVVCIADVLSDWCRAHARERFGRPGA